MLDLEKLELALNNRNELEKMQDSDRTLVKHMNAARDVTIQLDKTNLGLAYHVHCMKPCLEGNTFGFPTDFEAFAESQLGIKRAQAFNLDAVGAHVQPVPGSNIYVDEWTWKNILESCTTDGETDWEKAKKKAIKSKTLGSTKVLTVVRLMNKVEMNADDVRAFIEKFPEIAYDGTVKDFEAKLKAPYKAIPAKTDKTAKPKKTDEEKAAQAAETEKTANEAANKLRKEEERTIMVSYKDMVAIMSMCAKCTDTVPVSAELYHKFLANADFAKYYEEFLEKAKKALAK